MKSIQIAIDGPASSGKSTVAKRIAKTLGYTYLDTGAMYRAVTYLALEKELGISDQEAIVAKLHQSPIRFERGEDGEQAVFVGNENVTRVIRENEVTRSVSAIAALPAVRASLVALQQDIAVAGGIVMDGRDIGTVVLPQAELKIFLVASVEERAFRRFKENQEKGIPTDLKQLEKEIAERDYKDSHRVVSPLKAASDAITFDTTGVSIEEVCDFILEKAQKILDNTTRQ